jgi:ribosomal protein L37E
MPRYRTIACEHCGHLLLKRDEYCEACGCMTRRERILWAAKALQIAAMLVAICFVYWEVSGLTFR